MKKRFSLLIVMLSGAMMMCAETVKLNGIYYSLGSTSATVLSDQSSDKSAYASFINVTIPSSVSFNNYTYPVTAIGTSAFEGLNNLQSVTLPSSIKTIGTDAFYACPKLGSVNLPEGIATIGLRAFYNCNLDTVVIPSTVTSIGNGAFKGNPIRSIVWKPATCSIGSDDSAPFYSTSSQVTSFVFADGVEVVPAYICKNMTLLDTIVLPSSVYSLGQCAFMNCTSLKSINLPVTQKNLPVSFFEGCSSLESIELPATLTTISTDAFYGCTNLANVSFHEGITTIGLRAFSNCKLDSVVIPSTVTSIGNGAFKGNPIKSIVWKPATCSIGSDDSAPFYSTSSQVTSFVFADGVEVVPAYICKNMTLLDTIVLPSSVRALGQAAFMNCQNLKSINLPVTQKTLPVSFFEGCTSLEKIELPATLTTISTDAFYNCSALREIHNMANTPQTITEREIKNVNKHTCILYVPIDYIDLYRAKPVWCDFDNIIGVQTGLQFEEQEVTLTYLKSDSSLYYMDPQTWQVPLAPRIEGFKFLQWEVLPGNLAEGIILRAVYEADSQTANPADVVINPANPTQKLIREGNVYILRDDKIYTMKGQLVQ